MANVTLLLGSNIGNKKHYIDEAIKHIETEIGLVAKKSSIYKTAAWGKEDQDDFYNQVIILDTIHSPYDLLQKIMFIEEKIGRIRNNKWEERIIDIDILFYDNLIIKTDDLKIPHPLLHKRKFVLIPLIELEPTLIHPVFKVEVKDLIKQCLDNLLVLKVEK